jgi:Mn-dependent DtxR family transcriptional regulator
MTPTEKRILEIIQTDSTVTAKAISLGLGWSEKNGGRNVRKYLKRMSEKGLIHVVPQHIVITDETVPLLGKYIHI